MLCMFCWCQSRPRPRSLARAALIANTSCFVVAPIAGRPTSARAVSFLADLNAMTGFGSVTATASADGTTVTFEQATVPAGGWGTVEGVLNLPAHFPLRVAGSRARTGWTPGPPCPVAVAARPEVFGGRAEALAALNREWSTQQVEVTWNGSMYKYRRNCSCGAHYFFVSGTQAAESRCKQE